MAILLADLAVADPGALAGPVGAAAAALPCAALLLQPGDRSAAELEPVRAACRAAGIARLVDGPAELARALAADGAVVGADERTVSAARRRLGADAILGASCGGSRHAAMVAGEAGADFVVFDAPGEALAELAEWWSGLFLLPCLARGGAGPAEVRALVRAGADFVGLPAAAWTDPAALPGLRAALTHPARHGPRSG